MHRDLEGLPDYLVAALHAPEGTTVDDILARFPHARNDEPKEHPEFAERYDDAKFEWQRTHGWGDIPTDVAQ